MAFQENKFDIKQSLNLVGVGPGDPSMLTLGAVSAIKESTLIAYPVSSPEKESMAARIASKWITCEKKRMPLCFPMIADKIGLKKAWKEASIKLFDAVSSGEQVSFISQGDMSLFSTSGYLLLELKENYPELNIKLVPGITSISAAAAKAQLPLTFQQEQLLILPVPESILELEEILDEAALKKRTIALLKIGERWSWVRPILEKKFILGSSIFAQNVGLPDQIVESADCVPLGSKPYFSLLLIRQSWPELMQR